MAFIPSSFKCSDLVPAHTVIISKNTKKEQKMTTFCSFTLFSSLCTFSFGLRISSPYPHFGHNNTTPLRPGNPAAHPTCRLMLLPSGPDMIHRGESHETRTSSRNGRKQYTRCILKKQDDFFTSWYCSHVIERIPMPKIHPVFQAFT